VKWLSKLWETFRDSEKETTIVAALVLAMFGLSYLIGYLFMAFILWDLGWLGHTDIVGRVIFLFGVPAGAMLIDFIRDRTRF
jgi:hypothetical protein